MIGLESGVQPYHVNGGLDLAKNLLDDHIHSSCPLRAGPVLLCLSFPPNKQPLRR